jgi:hypothetical protein
VVILISFNLIFKSNLILILLHFLITANEAEALRENHNTELVRPYYIALLIVAIFAILTGIGFIAVLCVLMKIKTSAKASITRAPSETAYDNPTYKVNSSHYSLNRNRETKIKT